MANLALFCVRSRDNVDVLIGLPSHDPDTVIEDDIFKKLAGTITDAIRRILDKKHTEKKLSQLNMYLSVSSMLTQSLDINGLMETILYFCGELVSAEAGSVLLLDDEKEFFYFYQVEGTSKPVLLDTMFPADQGIAGSVMKTRQSEVINDVYNDPRFYNKIDLMTDFQTRNMIAIPLVAKDESIGVLEMLNKTEGPFTEDDHLLLLPVAEEIAFALRNAKLFEYVVNSYCKIRQGKRSCEGCKRPLEGLAY